MACHDPLRHPKLVSIHEFPKWIAMASAERRHHFHDGQIMILVCGEALIDLFVGAQDGGTLSAGARAGGSLFNVAVGLARLGQPVAFLGGISTDRFGIFLTDALAEERVDTKFLKRSHRPTPLAVVATDAEGQPAYTFYANECAETDLLSADLPALDREVDAIALGSYTLAVGPIGPAFLELAEREAEHRVISLDPNLRLDLVGDLNAWHRRFDQFAATASIIKLSREDFIAAYGPHASPEEIVARWLAGRTLLVVITDGANGATAYHRDVRIHQSGRPISVVDTVGAGDTFHAALLTRLRQHGLLNRSAVASLTDHQLADLLRYAIAAASITCTRRGADLPRSADIETLFRSDEG